MVDIFLCGPIHVTIRRNNVEQLTVTAENSLTVAHYPRFLNASLDVRAGFVGRIRLKIPVSRLRSEPWHILMENVYVVTGPQRFENFDPDQESYLKSNTVWGVRCQVSDLVGLT